MKNKERTFHSHVGISLLAALILTACGQPQTEPEETAAIRGMTAVPETARTWSGQTTICNGSYMYLNHLAVTVF